MEARDAAEAVNLLRKDPWARRGILVHSEVIKWSVFLDSRQKAE
jgi:hypothetical protein